MEGLCVLAGRLAGGEEPRAALVGWMRAYIEHVGGHSGLAAAVDTGLHEDSALVAGCRSAIAEAGGRLLDTAVRTGAVRDDLRIDDLPASVNAVAATPERGGPERSGRLLRLVLEGIGR